jgi:hypothetical protein
MRISGELAVHYFFGQDFSKKRVNGHPIAVGNYFSFFYLKIEQKKKLFRTWTLRRQAYQLFTQFDILPSQKIAVWFWCLEYLVFAH